jgi:hypothetical protein
LDARERERERERARERKRVCLVFTGDSLLLKHSRYKIAVAAQRAFTPKNP